MTVLRQCLTAHRFVFYIFGLTSYPRKKLNPKWHQIYRLPSALLVLIFIALILLSVYFMYYNESRSNDIYLNGEISSLLVIIYTGVIFVSNLMAVACELFGFSSAELLLKQCDRMEQQLKLHMFAEFDLKRLRAKITVKYRYIAGAYLQSLTVFLVMSVFEKADPRMGFLLYSLQAFSTIIQLHTVLHTELMHFILQSLNSELDGGKFVDVTRLRGLQTIYLEVWRTVQTVNADQGWNLVTLLIVLVVDMINDVFWIYKALRVNADNTEVIRKFLFVFFVCVSFTIITLGAALIFVFQFGLISHQMKDN